MSEQCHRTCIRMGAKEYELLEKKSQAAKRSANAWLMAQLETNRPLLFRTKEALALGRFMDEVGRKINAVARDFNSGYGAVEQDNSFQYTVAFYAGRRHFGMIFRLPTTALCWLMC